MRAIAWVSLIASLYLLQPKISLAGTKHSPLPAKIMDAKTAYIDNRTGQAELGDRAFDELKKWGRYRIVEDPKEADVIFLLTAQTYVTGSYTSGNVSESGHYSGSTVVTSTGWTYLTLVDPSSGAALWSNSKRWGKLLQGFRSATRALIKDLRKRIEEQQTEKSLRKKILEKKPLQR